MQAGAFDDGGVEFVADVAQLVDGLLEHVLDFGGALVDAGGGVAKIHAHGVQLEADGAQHLADVVVQLARYPGERGFVLSREPARSFSAIAGASGCAGRFCRASWSVSLIFSARATSESVLVLAAATTLRATRPYFSISSCGRSGFGVGVLDADEFHGAGMRFGDDLGDAHAEAGSDQMFFGDHDGAGFRGGALDGFAIERLDGVHVDDARGDAFGFERFGGANGFGDQQAVWR